MFFRLTGIKDISDKNYTLELLIEADDAATVKKFLGDQKVIIIWLEIYQWDIANFGKSYIVVKYWDTLVKIIWNFEDLEQFVEYVFQLELEVIDANYILGNQLSETQVQEIINSAREKQIASKKAHQERLKAAQAAEKINFNDKKLQKAYQAIDDIVNQIDQLMEIWGSKIQPITRKKLDDTRGEMGKLRLATNYDKIIEELHSAMNLIVETQDFLLDLLENDKIFAINPETKITNVDIIREQTRLAKANLLQVLGAQMSREETMYASLGHLKIFTQYLTRDFKFVLSNKPLFLKQVFKGIEIVSLFVLVELIVLTVLNPVLKLSLSLERVWVVFIYIAVFALLFSFFNHKIRPQTSRAYLGWLVLILLVYAAIMYFLKILLIF